MARRNKKPTTAAEAVREALARATSGPGIALKPIEIVKTALGAYQSYTYRQSHSSLGATPRADSAGATRTVSDDRLAFERGRQDALDRALFNVNYWRSAYETRIVRACGSPTDAQKLLSRISTWGNHAMRLNTLTFEQAQRLFERFCPPLCENNRRGNSDRIAGKGPVPDFLKAAQSIIVHENAANADELSSIVANVKAEARVYQTLSGNALDAAYDLLPVWCLQNRLELLDCEWWDDSGTMLAVAATLRDRFLEMGYDSEICRYFYDSVSEAMESYELTISSTWDDWQSRPIDELLTMVRNARRQRRDDESDFEIDGYENGLPAWLAPKEQLVWNIVVCAVYGPTQTRPFLPEAATNPVRSGNPAADVLTNMAHAAYRAYVLMDVEQGESPAFSSFEAQPEDLRASLYAQVESIHDKLTVLGYHIVPTMVCSPNQRVDALSPSEVECLAILEHRRWLAERKNAGWTLGTSKDATRKLSPHLVEWEQLSERARERDRYAVRAIPQILASVGLAISR